MSDIRNSDGIWINSQVFREEAIHFHKYGYYCADAIGTPSYYEYWDEQERRCREGYSVGGAHITGHHYFYLNFTYILLTEADDDEVVKRIRKKKASQKKSAPPDFWDGDYNYFWALELAWDGIYNTSVNHGIITNDEADRIYQLPEQEKTKETIKLLDMYGLDYKIEPKYLEGGYNLIVGKARRKGYSYKNSAVCVNIYNTIPESLTIIGAFDTRYLYPRGTMGMATKYINHVNKHTAFFKAKEYVDKQEHKRASYKEIENGIGIESGYLSEIQAISFKDNPDAARGKDARIILFEEAGKFPNLIASFRATEDSMADGIYQSGQMVIFGTGGDMKKGTLDFSKMFYNPLEYNCMPFVNIWDDNADKTSCSFFHPDYMNLVGHYDSQGNSNKKEAINYENNKRQLLLTNSSSSSSLQHRVQEHPQKPKEAFLTISSNDFPIVELQERLNKVTREKLYLKKGTVGWLTKERGKVKFVPDLNKELEPLWHYEIKTSNLAGAVIIYEAPIPGINYKGGYDPYRQNQASTSVSLGSSFILKPADLNWFSNCIVAEYVGRPNNSSDYHRILEMLLEWYNETAIMHENEVTSVKDYFMKNKKLHLLARQPDNVISKSIKNSKVKRVYGCHMNNQLKDAGEKYIKEWLLEERGFDEDGNLLITIDTIYSPALLEELIMYNRENNFDRVMSLMQLIFQLQEDSMYTYDETKVVENAEDLKKLLPQLFSKN